MGWASEHRESPAATIARLQADVDRLEGELAAERVAAVFQPHHGAATWRPKTRIEVIEWDGNPANIEPFLHTTTLRLRDGTDLLWYDDDEWHPVPVGSFINVTRVPYTAYRDRDAFLGRWERAD